MKLGQQATPSQTPIYPFLFSIVIIMELLLLGNGCLGGSHPSSPKLDSLDIFDEIVTAEFLEPEFSKEERFSFVPEKSADARVYQASSYHMREEGRPILSCIIVVTAAGALLNPGEHRRKREEFAQRYANTKPEYFQTMFPLIGSRAHYEFFGAGPGGSASGLTFTTDDERFDIRLTTTQRIPDTARQQSINIYALAKRLNEAYMKHRIVQ